LIHQLPANLAYITGLENLFVIAFAMTFQNAYVTQSLETQHVTAHLTQNVLVLKFITLPAANVNAKILKLVLVVINGTLILVLVMIFHLHFVFLSNISTKTAASANAFLFLLANATWYSTKILVAVLLELHHVRVNHTVAILTNS
jgi:hypothetical protein